MGNSNERYSLLGPLKENELELLAINLINFLVRPIT